MRVVASGCNLAVWKRAAPRNRMRETFTSGSVGGLVEQSPILPGQATATLYLWLPQGVSRRRCGREIGAAGGVITSEGSETRCAAVRNS